MEKNMERRFIDGYSGSYTKGFKMGMALRDPSLKECFCVGRPSDVHCCRY